MSALAARRLLLTGTAAAAAFASTGAQAQSGTTAGTVITNTASASYSVNGVNQTKTSNTVTFKVDRKVNLTLVAAQGANTQVAIGQSGAVLKYRLTNSTNGTQDFLLTVSQGILLGGDNFDVTAPQIFVDNGDGVYNAADDKLTFVNELAADTSVVVFVVADIPTDQATQLANITLNAQVAAGGDPSITVPGAALTASATNDDQTVDVVFADTDAILPRDGRASATLAYEIATRDVALTVVKSQTVISDPINAGLVPKAIPGAVVQYCLIVNNATALTSANGVNVTDTIPPNTTYVPNSITVGGIPLAGACVLGTPMNDGGGAVSGSPYTASYTAGTRLITATIPTVLGLQSLGVTFQVTIN